MQRTEQANIVWNEGVDARSLAENLAGELVIRLQTAIANKGSAVIAFSGGSTPKPLFEALAEHDVEWDKVVITLVDERWVPETHDLSNAAFLKRFLLDHLPDGVRFVPLYQKAQSVRASYPLVLQDFIDATGSNAESLRDFDVVILGMGGDGHTASFFPDADNVAELVSIEASDPLLSCSSPSTQVERITWSLPALLNCDFLVLHFTGEDKLDVFEQAVTGGGDFEELPIRSAIFQDRAPLNVFYSA